MKFFLTENNGKPIKKIKGGVGSMKILGTGYGLKGIEFLIDADIYHVYVKSKGLSIEIIDRFKIEKGKSIPHSHLAF